MMIKIAVVGSKEFMENLFPIAQKLEGIEIDPYIYLHPAESSELLKCLKPCDVIFFSGALPYYMAKEIKRTITNSKYILTARRDNCRIFNSFYHVSSKYSTT